MDARALPLLRAAQDRLGRWRCQTFALADAARTDPACALSADHALLAGTHCKAEQAAPDFVYRQNSTAPARLAELVR